MSPSARPVMFEWTEGRSVPVSDEGTGPPVLLAHGAGAGQGHPFMTGMRARLVRSGFAVTAFDYPYVAEGRKAPDPLKRLVECHRAVWESGEGAFLMGKSMGGRVGSHLGVPAPGLVFLGYPLVAPGKREPRDTDHLAECPPMLFVQGTRDPLAPLDLIEALVGGLANASLHVVEGGDHSFRRPKAMGVPLEETLDEVAAAAADWMSAQSGG